MTDAAPADSLLDAFHSFAAVAVRQPIEVKVALALAAMLALIMIVDGVRANFFAKKKAASLYILREGHGAVRGPQRLASAKPPVRRSLPKKSQRKLSPHKAKRPGINRVPLDRSVAYDAYQPTDELVLEEVREDDTSAV